MYYDLQVCLLHLRALTDQTLFCLSCNLSIYCVRLAFMPAFMMKRTLCENFPTDGLDQDTAASLDFVAERVCMH